jgi:chromosome segregation ATPase
VRSRAAASLTSDVPGFLQPWLKLLQRVQEEHQRQIADQRRAHEQELSSIQQQIERQITVFSQQHQSSTLRASSQPSSGSGKCAECTELKEKLLRLEMRHSEMVVASSRQWGAPSHEHEAQAQAQQERLVEAERMVAQASLRESVLVQSMQQLEARCADAERAASEAVGNYQKAKGLLRDLVAEHRALQQQISTQPHTAEATGLEASLKALQAEHKSLQSSHSALQSQYKDALRSAERSEGEVRQLKGTIEKHKHESDFMQSSLAAAQNKIAALTTMMEKQEEALFVTRIPLTTISSAAVRWPERTRLPSLSHARLLSRQRPRRSPVSRPARQRGSRLRRRSWCRAEPSQTARRTSISSQGSREVRSAVCMTRFMELCSI